MGMGRLDAALADIETITAVRGGLLEWVSPFFAPMILLVSPGTSKVCFFDFRPQAT